jgi:hypothetical protein
MMMFDVPVDTLATVAEANCYHACRSTGVAWAPLTDERKQQLLREAFDYLRGEYGQVWTAGVPFGVLADGVTVALGARDACSLLALRALAGPLDPEMQPQVIESTLGPITKKYAAAPNNGRRTFPDVGRLMGPYLSPIVRGSVPLVRA